MTRMNNTWLAVAALAASGAATGCATEYATYAPTGINNEQGYLTAEYAIPPGNPQAAKGHLYVTSFGGRPLPASGDKPAGQYLQVRVAAANDTDPEPWVLDAREQIVDFDGQVSVKAAFSDGSAAPGVPLSVGAGQKGYVDLYFPMPAAADPRVIQVGWHMRRANEELADRAVFNRIPGQDERVYAYQPYESGLYLGIGVGPGWWWGPRPWWAWNYDWPYGYGYGVLGLGWGYPGYYGRGYYPHARGYFGGYYGGGGWRGGGSPTWHASPPGGGSFGGGGAGRSVHMGRPAHR